jgi:amino acid transporter
LLTLSRLAVRVWVLTAGNGGYVLWAQAAFGDFWALISGVNGLVSSVFDLALYPALFAEYATTLTDLTGIEVCDVDAATIAQLTPRLI